MHFTRDIFCWISSVFKLFLVSSTLIPSVCCEEGFAKNMVCLCWVFVLVVIVVPLSDARPDKCEQSELLLADLDLAEGVLKRAKLLVPNCGTEVTTEDPSTKVAVDDIRLPMDCQDLQADGVVMTGVYTIWLQGKSVQVRCDMDTENDGGGWTVIQRRGKFSKQLIFHRDWKNYKNGFGNLQEEFWLGNDPIFALSNQGNYSLRIDVTAVDGHSAFHALYQKFRISDEKLNYTLHVHGYNGNAGPQFPKERFRPMDCKAWQAAGFVTSGVYRLWPRGGKSVRVRCDMDTDGGGWTVIQRRGNFSQQENFDRDWQDYKNGFGNLERDFWLGNDHIFALSNQRAYSLRVDMTAADGDSAYAVFRVFWIDDENSNYTLRVIGYNGTAGDDMSYSNGAMFSTKDRKNNKGSSTNCAMLMKGGFWYDSCAACNPNGLYKPGVKRSTSVYYLKFKGFEGMFFFEMKIKRI